MKTYQLTIIAVIVLAFGACSSTQPTNTATVNQPANDITATTETKTTNDSQPSSQPAVTGSPSEVLKSFTEATQKKDIETIKKTLSKGTLKVSEESAKKQNISLDEMLMKIENTKDKKLPEVRNEKIDGDTATVEVKNEGSGEYDVMPFVKEDGSWKLALDLFMEGMRKKFEEESKKTAPKATP